ncbi:MAG: hypothetical protein OWR52_13445 [Acidibacillus sp.]|uniref:Uncharacterized protein n=1 Tax=Sulfoacidibacillus ferrooxidans TaxID=2005001 RepID=A0A9X1VA05_9BACL|nr:hypothetical protein [Sulfoacidibacillus ferrooxidans]MCI0184004.1 hypothetical protein [Sulfoacidibacillus ferrooxidans]MCY0894489.1 hypothetical protein [Acidibacillus sp.]
MSVARAVLLRLIIGLGIAVLGILLSVATKDWSIEYNWFGMLGMILLGLSGIAMFSTGARQRWSAKSSAHSGLNKDKNVSHSPTGNAVHWAITFFIIGAINFLAPIFIYYTFHPEIL